LLCASTVAPVFAVEPRPLDISIVQTAFEMLPHAPEDQLNRMQLGLAVVLLGDALAPAGCVTAVSAANQETATFGSQDQGLTDAILAGLGACAPGCWAQGSEQDRVLACQAAGLPGPHTKAEPAVWLAVAAVDATVQARLKAQGHPELAERWGQHTQRTLELGW
jgi:hypothetical protein